MLVYWITQRINSNIEALEI